MLKKILSKIDPNNWDHTILCDPRSNPELQEPSKPVVFEKVDKTGFVYWEGPAYGKLYLGEKGVRAGEILIIGTIILSLLLMSTL